MFLFISYENIMPIKISFKKFPGSELRYVYVKIKSTDPDFNQVNRNLVTLFENCQQVASNAWTNFGLDLFSHFSEPRYLKTPLGPKRLFSIKSGPLFVTTLSRYTVYVPPPIISVTLHTDPEDPITSLT